MRKVIAGVVCGTILGIVVSFYHIQRSWNECSGSIEVYVNSQLHSDLANVFNSWKLPDGIEPKDLASSYMHSKCFANKVKTW